MNNINIYNERMSKAIIDKLWFMRFLKMNVFNNGDNGAIVYDLGCADGELIRHLAPEFPNIEFVGIDNSDDMINLARQRQEFPNERYINNRQISREACHDMPVILIMSSVFHEIVNYEKFPKAFLDDLFFWIKPDYIFFRDMIPNESINRHTLQSDIDKIKDKIEFNQILEFNIRQGDISNQRNFVHLLLKYRYIENWDREVRENYFPCTYQELMSFFPNFNIIYSKQYTLPYIQQIVKEDFDIDLMDCTHVNIVMKRKG